ncbi:Putative up-regulated during septation protein [Septoria linicola]|uniref:Up-regulated during septation protein n=1 Tax=Septoria linicola TaxID=215465 RepID=A0A9Q9EHY9_9PEZI|nr:Putative up-regulated during septation protein [Septoria linicola]
MMQSNGDGYHHGRKSIPEYESYDGSGYGSPLSSARNSYVNGKPLPAMPTRAHALSQSTNGGYGDFDFDASFPDPPRQPVSSATHTKTNGNMHHHFRDIKFGLESPVMTHHIHLDTQMHGEKHDVVGRHLLYETALLDTQSYEILDMVQIDELKKEHTRLNSRIDAANRKLTLESKMKDAAQNLNRLPDTPQSPDKDRHSLLGGRNRTSSNQSGHGLVQAEDELSQSIKKVDELNEQIRTLMDRRLVVERMLLRHTAAVLADQANKPSEAWLANGHRNLDDDDEVLGHAPDGFDEFDGIRDILKGAPASSRSNAEVQRIQDEHEQQLASMRDQMQLQHEQTLNSLRQRSELQRSEHEQQMASMQKRMDQLNSQLREIITDASRVRGQEPEAEPQIGTSESVKGSLDNTFILLGNNVQIMQQEREKNKAHYARIQDSSSETRDAVEKKLESLNSQLHSTLQTSSVMEALKDLKQPPGVTGHGYEDQLQYLQDSLLTMEKLLQEHNEQLEIAKHASSGIQAAQSTAAKQAQRVAEYETVVAGLWEIVSAEQKPAGLTPRGSFDAGRNSALSAGSHSSRSPTSPIREDFSLQAFGARVQHIFDVANGAKEQQDILRRQIQQQRDLNGKSDMEKDREIQELQAQYEALNSSYDATQQDLAKAVENHLFADQQAQQAQKEMQDVMSELDQLRKTVDAAEARSKAVDERHALIMTERDSLGAERDAHKQKLEDVQQEMQDMESELVRLTTELTMAKAELEGAYGTRKERQKEAGASEAELDALAALKDQEIAQLRREHGEKTKLLEQELQDMMTEFQEMTRESLELEKERGQLENLIDTLRERTEQLEGQLSDTKVQWMGVKSPGGPDGVVKESTSVMVLRQEFKKMMRESRAEGLRLLRAEQEERRRLETEVRKTRQLNSPLGRGPARTSSLAHNRLNSIASSHGGTSLTNGTTATSLGSPPTTIASLPTSGLPAATTMTSPLSMQQQSAA